jgi:hypothetical protein
MFKPVEDRSRTGPSWNAWHFLCSLQPFRGFKTPEEKAAKPKTSGEPTPAS